jgi:hypothetical protein
MSDRKIIRLPRYTQGDWYPSDDNGCKDICIRGSKTHDEDEDLSIATLHTEGNSIGYTHGLNCEVEDQANADVICASPRMLEFIAKRAENGDDECFEFLKATFKVKSCDDCYDRFQCYTEKKFRHT